MDKLRFDFEIKAAADGKTNVLSVTSIATPAGQVFALPLESQPANLHPELAKTPNYAK
ncbi:unnamed protein product, partial [Nesidiocoris tenuis]